MIQMFVSPDIGTERTKAILLPSGEVAGCCSEVELFVRSRLPLPFTPITKMSDWVVVDAAPPARVASASGSETKVTRTKAGQRRVMTLEGVVERFTRAG
jgi:hypothetical protein